MPLCMQMCVCEREREKGFPYTLFSVFQKERLQKDIFCFNLLIFFIIISVFFCLCLSHPLVGNLGLAWILVPFLVLFVTVLLPFCLILISFLFFSFIS